MKDDKKARTSRDFNVLNSNENTKSEIEGKKLAKKKKRVWTEEEKKNHAWLAPTKWKPGFCPNPKGRPLKRPITSRYEEAIEIPLPDDVRKQLGLKKGAVLGDAIARNVVEQAAFSRTRAVEPHGKCGKRPRARLARCLLLTCWATPRF